VVDPASGRAVSLQECFEFFSMSDVLDEHNQWFCPRCRTHVCAEKTMQVWSVPECLILHLKRFTATKKIESLIDFPAVLDMGPHVVGPQRGEKLEYALYAVSEHMGGLHGGHYTAHALLQRADRPGKWYSFNDSGVFASREEGPHSSNAYVFFYQRIHEPRVAKGDLTE
jgi:ubiquitin C-terminal hydrolase